MTTTRSRTYGSLQVRSPGCRDVPLWLAALRESFHLMDSASPGPCVGVRTRLVCPLPSVPGIVCRRSAAYLQVLPRPKRRRK